MRLLHTADWHIGRSLMGQSRQEDIRAAVEQVVGIARAERPDLVVHAGDVFDGLRPAYEDLRWGVEALRELASVAPTIVICGNHDAPALFGLLDRLLGPDPRLRFVARALPPEMGGVIELPGPRDEVVRVAPIPFIHANRIVEYLEDPATWMTGYADRVDRVVQALARGLTRGYDPGRHVLVLAAHLFVTGVRFSTSERQLTVSDVYATHAERLPEAVLLSVQEDCAATRVRVLTEADAAPDREPTFQELFRDFVALRGTRAGSAERAMRYFDDLLSAVEQEEPAQLPDVDRLEAPAEAT